MSMKASAFSYARATSVDSALELLAIHGEQAKVLSGGQSLTPAMNLRLIAPEWIVDIGGLDELRGIAAGEVLRIRGAAHGEGPSSQHFGCRCRHPAVGARGTRYRGEHGP
jgi:CO/xanthine dehydrogenase FAD-binding subunit